ncbi:HDIG domain-containing protein [Treponema sp. OttesenSCG-928-L16]|nr:HDIG domain-containing protein [Treponema sp. OttesenSCG-928-L16]
MKPDRKDAENLWRKYNSDEGLWRHALSVEAAMRHFAEKAGEDADVWGIIGLIHDIDYEQYPDEHCVKARPILEEAAWPEEYIRAVVSHGWGLCTDVEPLSALEKTLYAVDELTGFISACALVRPSKSVMDLEVKSVKKKWKTPAFAAGVDRRVIEKGAELLGISLEDLINETILAMRAAAKEIGLG